MSLTGKDRYAVAVVGATGAVGNELIEILEERNFPVGALRFFASEQSRGKRIEFRGQPLKVEVLKEDSFLGMDLAFFCAGADVSKTFAPLAVRAGCTVVDSSPQWRMTPEVPLIVPEVNGQGLGSCPGIVASPGVSATQMAMVLKPVDDAFGIRRVTATTLEAVSGSGMKAMEDLLHQSADILNMKEVRMGWFTSQVAFNVIPQVGEFVPDGNTAAEKAMAGELSRLLGRGSLQVTGTAVLVPVFRGNSASVNIEMTKHADVSEVRAVLSRFPGLVVFDAPEKSLYPFPVDVSGRDEVYVGRIRKDESSENGINLWIVTDNLRKGSALNLVQIAEQLLARPD